VQSVDRRQRLDLKLIARAAGRDLSNTCDVFFARHRMAPMTPLRIEQWLNG
jgi:hypothetical protein